MDIIKIFNVVHNSFSAVLYDFSKNKDYESMKEATFIFDLFLNYYERVLNEEIDLEKFGELKKLSFRSFERDLELINHEEGRKLYKDFELF